MSTNSAKNKIQGFFEKVGKRNMLIAGAVLLVAAAVLLNWVFFSAGQKSGYDQYAKGTGAQQTGEQDTTKNQTDARAEYYSGVQVSRQRARDEALEVLQSVVDNKDATETVKNEALAEMQVIATEIEKEANIETLLKSKGFSACVALLNGDNATIIVSNADGSTELSATQLAQINTVVYEQAKILPTSINIQVK